jgi:hypothetical protein
VAPHLLFPRAVKRREHRVGRAGLGPQRAGVVDHVQARVGDDLQAGPRHALLTVPREGRDVSGGVHRLRPDVGGQRRQFALGRPVPDHEPAATRAQRCVEIRQALEQELRPRAGGMATVQQPVVEAEHGHDTLVRRKRRP